MKFVIKSLGGGGGSPLILVPRVLNYQQNFMSLSNYISYSPAIEFTLWEMSKSFVFCDGFSKLSTHEKNPSTLNLSAFWFKTLIVWGLTKDGVKLTVFSH